MDGTYLLESINFTVGRTGGAPHQTWAAGGVGGGREREKERGEMVASAGCGLRNLASVD